MDVMMANFNHFNSKFDQLRTEVTDNSNQSNAILNQLKTISEQQNTKLDQQKAEITNKFDQHMTDNSNQLKAISEQQNTLRTEVTDNSNQLNAKFDQQNDKLDQFRAEVMDKVDKQNTELKETIRQQINGVNDKLDQQKAEVKLILQNYEEGNVRQFAEVKVNIETMENRLDGMEMGLQSLKEEVEERCV